MTLREALKTADFMDKSIIMSKIAGPASSEGGDGRETSQRPSMSLPLPLQLQLQHNQLLLLRLKLRLQQQRLRLLSQLQQQLQQLHHLLARLR